MSGLFLGHELHRGYDGTRRGDRAELATNALMTHAFVCGASGMGKTVFAKSIVEEVALAGVPVIAIDLKGDLASLALNGNLVRSRGLERVFGDAAEPLRAEFNEGLESSPSLEARHLEFATKVDVRLFTPGYDGARRLAMTGLPTFTGPAADPLERQERRTLVEALARGLCPVRARGADGRGEREVKFVEELLWHLVETGADLTGTGGIRQLGAAAGDPPFDDLGGMPLDEFVKPAWRNDLRARLAARITGNERTWYEGARLDVETLIGHTDGRTPLAVLYLGHLSSFDEQANVVAQTCSEVYRWMRRLGGSPKLRALVYLDEVGGGDGRYAFYPSAPYNPPSKPPLTLLVKQGRSAGVGVLLATQNPKSVDVRGLGNINTWAVGKLTQRADFERIDHLLTATRASPGRIQADIMRAEQGEFLLQAPGIPDPKWVKERWLYTLHQTLSPEQVHTIYMLQGEEVVPVPAATPTKVRRPAAPPVTPSPLLDSFALGDEESPAVRRPPSGDGETKVLAPTTSVVEDAPESADGACWALIGPEHERRLLVGATCAVGRGEGVEYRLAADTVSRRHMEVIALKNGQVRVANLSAKNPVRVRGEPLEGTVTFSVEDSPVELKVGGVKVRLRWG